MTLQEALVRNAEELSSKVEEHCMLLALAKEIDAGTIELPRCPLLVCPHARRLREMLLETITVLEETRKAFRSKQLEVLRKKLIGVLAEEA